MSNQKAKGSKEGKTITLLQLGKMNFSNDLAKFSRGKIDLELNWLKKKTKPQKEGWTCVKGKRAVHELKTM